MAVKLEVPSKVPVQARIESESERRKCKATTTVNAHVTMGNTDNKKVEVNNLYEGRNSNANEIKGVRNAQVKLQAQVTAH